MSIKKTVIQGALKEVYEQQKPIVKANLQDKLRYQDDDFYSRLEGCLDYEIDSIIQQVVPGQVEESRRALLQVVDAFCAQVGNVLIPQARSNVKEGNLPLKPKQLGKKIAQSLRKSRQDLEQAIFSLLPSEDLETPQASSDTVVNEAEELTTANPEDVLYFPEDILGGTRAASIIDQCSDLESRQVPSFYREYLEKMGGLDWPVRYFKDENARSVQIITQQPREGESEGVHVMIVPTYADENEEYGKPDFVNSLCRAKLAESIDPIFSSFTFKVKNREGEAVDDQAVINFVTRNMAASSHPLTDMWVTDLRHKVDPELTRVDLQTALWPLYLNFAFPQLDEIVQAETGYAFEPVEKVHQIANIKASIERYNLTDEPLLFTALPAELERGLREITDPYELREKLFSPAVQSMMEPKQTTYIEVYQKLEELIKQHPQYASPGDTTNPFRFGNIDPFADFYVQVPSLEQTNTSYEALELYEQALQVVIRGSQMPFQVTIKRDENQKTYFEVEWFGWPEGF